MNLDRAEAMRRLAAADHGVLCTVHPERGVDAVPVAFAVDGDTVGVPVDLVKPKASTRLQRERNLAADPRATLLVEHWDADDWSRLWWVRAELRWLGAGDATVDAHHRTLASRLTSALAARYAPYREQPFAKVLLLQVVDVTGWAAADGAGDDSEPDDAALADGAHERWSASWRAWRASRWAAVTAPYGVAALTSTTWLSSAPVDVEELGERWVARSGRAEREDGAVSLSPDEERTEGRLLLRAVERDGQLALRILDPDAPGRTSLRAIDAFTPDPSWVCRGGFEPAPGATQIDIDHVGGRRWADDLAGTVHLQIGGHSLSLAAFPRDGGGVWFVFADETNGRTTQQFRFLAVDPPEADGTVTVDFNRAYLPPCAFSDAYVCPLPPPGNRLPFAVEAGETFPRRG